MGSGRHYTSLGYGIGNYLACLMPIIIMVFFGVESVDVHAKNDSLNEIAERELHDFEGFITKRSNNLIEVRFRNEEAMEDTVLIDLLDL
jgi:hypothetical protein